MAIIDDSQRQAGFGAVGGADDVQKIVNVDAAYQVLVDDDIVAARGSFTVTLPNIASAKQEVTITCVAGRITIAGDASIQPPTVITTSASVTLFPTEGEWRQK